MYRRPKRMCTFFLRIGVIAVLLSGCHRGSEIARGQPAPRPDTVVITVPVLRFTPADSAEGSAALDSASLELLERRVMSRLGSLMRAENERASGGKGVGITPVKNPAPDVQQGLLGAITFSEDGTLGATSRERIAAIADMLRTLEGPLEIRAVAATDMHSVDIGIARARRVYLELIADNPSLAERDVAITISASNAAAPGSNQHVQVFWRATN